MRTFDVDRVTESICNQYYQDLKVDLASTEKISPGTKDRTISSYEGDSPTGGMLSFGNHILDVVLKKTEKLEVEVPKRKI